MQSSEFINYFKSFPNVKNHFLGVFSINTLPKSIKHRKFCICNTDVESGNGKHWICFVRSNKDTIELFDSLGIDDEKKKLITKYCTFNAKEIIFNETQFQADFSETCGLFVIYFLIERIFNFDLTFEELLHDIFYDDKLKNEKKVIEFCSEIIEKS
jgi:hypothetical protein